MTYTLSFFIKGLPPTTNKVLAMGLRERLRSKKRWKDAVIYSTVGKRPPTPLVKASLTLTRHSSIRPDPDGLTSTFKHIIDGLVIAKVLQNDKFENIGFPKYEWEKTAKNEGKISVLVEEV